MASYKVTRASTALSTTNDIISMIAAASKKCIITSITVGGMGTTSAANSLIVARSTGGTTPATALTPALTDTDDDAANTAVWTAWTGQPTLASNPLLRIPVNANGGVTRIVFPPGHEIRLRNSEQLSFRSETGTSNIVITVEFSE